MKDVSLPLVTISIPCNEIYIFIILSPLSNILVPAFSKKTRGQSILLSVLPSIPLQVVGTLCMQLILQFYSDPFETVPVRRSWPEDVHIVRI